MEKSLVTKLPGLLRGVPERPRHSQRDADPYFGLALSSQFQLSFGLSFHSFKYAQLDGLSRWTEPVVATLLPLSPPLPLFAVATVFHSGAAPRKSAARSVSARPHTRAPTPVPAHSAGGCSSEDFGAGTPWRTRHAPTLGVHGTRKKPRVHEGNARRKDKRLRRNEVLRTEHLTPSATQTRTPDRHRRPSPSGASASRSTATSTRSGTGSRDGRNQEDPRRARRLLYHQ
ncbi:MAG: hypothetical protein G01um101438_865 [Parcubacteria group bacterium Gr01-1014_38]|nr:MAG: hypothetical protein G01um101438_865 [Parcubacteria group bacterium Gr01-1014_38]